MTNEFGYGQHNPVLAPGEAILWRGKPKRSAFIATKSLTLMPIAIIWLILDMNFIIAAFSGGEMLFFLIPFFALHLMPVWIWLGSMLTAGKRWKNTNYYVDLRNANLRIGLLDKLFHTGDIVFDNGLHYHSNRKQHSPSLEDLEDAPGVYQRIQRIILDMQTDMEYPNAFRPAENPGYHTEYGL